MVGLTPEVLLARALVGDYDTIVGLYDGHACGFMIYGVNRDVLTIVALHLPNHAKEFIEEFDRWCRSLNVRQYVALSQRNPDAYARLFGLQFHHAVFTKEVK